MFLGHASAILPQRVEKPLRSRRGTASSKQPPLPSKELLASFPDAYCWRLPTVTHRALSLAELDKLAASLFLTIATKEEKERLLQRSGYLHLTFHQMHRAEDFFLFATIESPSKEVGLCNDENALPCCVSYASFSDWQWLDASSLRRGKVAFLPL